MELTKRRTDSAEPVISSVLTTVVVFIPIGYLDGVVMLIGIVVYNSIILIDFVNKRRSYHTDSRQAIIEAAQMRMRPILTTTCTTIGGLIPHVDWR